MEDKQVLIKVENLHKKFSRSLKRSMLYGSIDVARNMLWRPSTDVKLRKGEFWSLKDVNFEVKKGEALGVIGQNGSGKTTLLRMLNGIFPPDKGSISIKGRMGALIAIGAGFHPHLSGRENIYLNGSILGMSKKEIDEKFEQIVDFSELREFIDAPVATYSSGMTVRLGFSVVIHSDVDLLIADEGLAVGDLAFVLKCYRKIAEFRKNGGTIVLVSHGINLIRNTCQNVLWLDKGETKMYGDVQKVCDAYESFMLDKDSNSNEEKGSIINNDPLCHVTGMEFINKDGEKVEKIGTGDYLRIRLNYSCKREVQNPVFSVTMQNPENVVAICHFSIHDGYKIDKISGDGYIDLIIEKFSLKAADYICSLTFTENNDPNNILEWHEKSYKILVEPNDIITYGITNTFPKWELHHS